MTLRQFEPTTVWSDKDGFLTERAKGYLRGLWDYIGASSGTLPIGSLGAPGGTTQFLRADGTWSVPAYPTAGHIVEDEGTPLTQRGTLNFVGAGVAVTDTGSKTLVTISSGGGGYSSIEDEGTPLTARTTVNFAGAGVSVADSGGKTVVTVAGSTGPSWTEAEIDFGALPVYEASFTITDAAITSSALKMQVLPCGKAATGRTADDWQWDGAVFAANPGTGSATCYATFMPGPIVGKRKIQYSVGA